MRRVRVGSRREQIRTWPPVPLAEMSGGFPAEQYLEQQLRADPSRVEELIVCPDGVDEKVWIAENMRMFLRELNDFILFFKDVCTAETKPVMKITLGGDQCVFLCSAFDPPREVSAISYMTLTVDQATMMFTSEKQFPSRSVVKKSSAKQFSVWARRIYRIFAFAYYEHRAEYDLYEASRHLCERFTRFCLLHKLMKADGLMIPATGSSAPPQSGAAAAASLSSSTSTCTSATAADVL